MEEKELYDEVVISGIAGTFPKSDNLYDLHGNLINKVQMLSKEKRWKFDDPEIPELIGKLNVINKFDAEFFNINKHEADFMDPMMRIMFEKTYEAIVDAGYNPSELRGTKTAVIVGMNITETDKKIFFEIIGENGHGITGCFRSMFSNRISHWLGVHGPSYTTDSACSSGLYVVEQAYQLIKNGICDYVIVAGCHICLHPHVTLQYVKLGALSPDGKCKTFDESANGFCRAETVCVAFIQRSKNARRIHASIVHVKTNCDGYKEEGITYPSVTMQLKLLEEFYKECKIDPVTIEYVEAHGTGTKAGDLVEITTLDKIFCSGRKEPLKVGSIKSNLGHSEAAAGFCAIAKAILALETGIITPNMNLSTPRKDSEALQTGRIIVVTEPCQLNTKLIAINSFGFGGANSHALLKSNEKCKVNNGLPSDDLPRLVCVSGRTLEAVHVMLEQLETNPVDVEFVRLLHEIHKTNITGHSQRGYTLLEKDPTTILSRRIEPFVNKKRPVWLILSGTDSKEYQWLTIGKVLMNIPTFEKSIHNCHKILKSKGIDLLKIFVDGGSSEMFMNSFNSFLGATIVQIGIVDILKEIEVNLDGFIGYGISELICGYMDGCLTFEQTILLAYYWALSFSEEKPVEGCLAIVGASYEELLLFNVPPTIDVAYCKERDHCFLSGPTEDIDEVMKNLNSSGLLVTKLETTYTVRSSRYNSSAASKYYDYAREIILKPSERSSKWISSSVPEFKWKSAQLSSAEYYANNLSNRIYFENVTKTIPSNAIVLTVGPYRLTESSLNRSQPNDIVDVPLTKKHFSDIVFFLDAIGRMYLAGVNVKLYKIYSPVDFPVSKGTCMVAPFVKWNHNEDRFVAYFDMCEKLESAKRTVVISLNKEWEYISGHNIDSRILFPATGYLVLVWETFAMMMGQSYATVPVIFEDLSFHKAIVVPQKGEIKFTISIQVGSRNFEVTENDSILVTGHMYSPRNINDCFINLSCLIIDNEPQELILDKEDIYKDFRLKGYYYSGIFRNIVKSNVNGTIGHIRWANNAIPFLDNMIQLKLIGEDFRNLNVLTSIRKLVIDMKKFTEVFQKCSEEKDEVHVYYNRKLNVIKCDGIEIHGVHTTQISRKKIHPNPTLERYVFVPYIVHDNISFQTEEIIESLVKLIFENARSANIRTIELFDSSAESIGALVTPIILHATNIHRLQVDAVILGNKKHPLLANIEDDIIIKNSDFPEDNSAFVVIVTNLFSKNKQLLLPVSNSVISGGFVLNREDNLDAAEFEAANDLNLCADYVSENGRILLFKKADSKLKTDTKPIVVKITENSFDWIKSVQEAIDVLDKSRAERELILFSEKEPLNGILGFFNTFKMEFNSGRLKCFFIMDRDAPSFNPQHPFYEEQMKKNLIVNVYKDGCWGSYKYIQLKTEKLVKTHHAYVNTLIRGNLSTLKWIEGPINLHDNLALDATELLVHVYYASLNFRDVMVATGKLDLEIFANNRLKMDCLLGFECSGKADDGKRYMCIAESRSISSVIVNNRHLCWEFPEEWSLEEAATVPIVYGTVIYGLFMKARMNGGETVLIQSGAGGLGQAVINICLHHGCKIFTTVGTAEKRKFIRKTFPQIPENHIGNSKDSSFLEMVMIKTGGKGVDIVINSLAEEKLEASVRCLKESGSFLEMGKFDFMKDNKLEMNLLPQNSSFYGIGFDSIIKGDIGTILELKSLMNKEIKCGAIKPLIRTVFEHSDVENAFRYMAAGEHIGKVLLKLRDEEENKNAAPSIMKFDAIPRFLCYEDEVYIVCGGLGGIGLELVDWLVLRGARNIVLTSRVGIKTGYQLFRIRFWASYGAKIVILTEDITNAEGVENLLRKANALGSVAAIFNLAAIFLFAVFENETAESFKKSFQAKALGTYHLDQLSRIMCPKLKYFVVFSSISCGYGNVGLANYAMSNSVAERICESRRAANLPATAIQLGAVRDVGIVADMKHGDPKATVGGTAQQTITSCMEVIESFLLQSATIVSSMIPVKEAHTIKKEGTFVDKLAKILDIRDVKSVQSTTPLPELGVDSMLAIEVRQFLERECQVFLTSQEIRNLTFGKLYEIEAASTENETIAKSGTNNNQNLSNQVMLNLVISFKIPDESIASMAVVRLPSLLHNGSTTEVPTSQVPTTFFIPGGTGDSSGLQFLAKNLNVQVLCLQYNYENPPDTIEEISQSLLPYILSRISRDQQFSIVGYSYGGLVSLKVVELLGKKGHFGCCLLLIDCVPAELKRVIKLFIGLQSLDDFEIKILRNFSESIQYEIPKELMDNLHQLRTWDERLSSLVSSIPEGGTSYSKQYLQNFCNATYKRMTSIQFEDGEPNRILQASVTLIRPTELLITSDPSDIALLQSYFQSPLQIYSVEGNHFSILNKQKTADIISSRLKELYTPS